MSQNLSEQALRTHLIISRLYCAESYEKVPSLGEGTIWTEERERSYAKRRIGLLRHLLVQQG